MGEFGLDSLRKRRGAKLFWVW